jgi:hypothetical protein
MNEIIDRYELRCTKKSLQATLGLYCGYGVKFRPRFASWL